MFNKNFEILNDGGNYFWQAKGLNGKIVGKSQKFSRRIDAVANANRHGMDGNSEGHGINDKWEFLQDVDKWVWYRTSSNGRIVGQSKPFSRHIDCLSNAESFGYRQEVLVAA